MKKALMVTIVSFIAELIINTGVCATPTNKYLKYYDDRQTYYVTADIGLNIRRQPDINSSIIDTLAYGDEIEVLSVTEEDEEWTAIYYTPRKSVFYVNNNYISQDKPEAEDKSTDTNEEGTVSYTGEGDYLGTLRLTAYEHDGSLCANGNYPTEYWTCASNELPFGTIVEIAGLGEWLVEDTGGFGYGALDLFLGDPDACEEFGVQYADVWVVRYGY